MKSIKTFPFHKARRVTKEEVKAGRKAIESKLNIKRSLRKGRPPKTKKDKYVPISVRLHPQALRWLKIEAKKKSLPYQTIINELILREAA